MLSSLVPLRRLRSAALAVLSVMAAVVALAFGAPQAAAAGSLPCDIYATAGTPCVAAHSLVRALYTSYSGSLYQVKRASDSATADIGLLAAAWIRERGRAGLLLFGDDLHHHQDLRPVVAPQRPHGRGGRMGREPPMSERPRTPCR